MRDEREARGLGEPAAVAGRPLACVVGLVDANVCWAGVSCGCGVESVGLLEWMCSMSVGRCVKTMPQSSQRHVTVSTPASAAAVDGPGDPVVSSRADGGA